MTARRAMVKTDYRVVAAIEVGCIHLNDLHRDEFPYQHLMIATNLIEGAQGADFPMTADEQVRDFINVSDVAVAFARRLDYERVQPGKARIANVGPNKVQTLTDFALHWWKEFGATRELRVVPEVDPGRL